MNSIFLLQLLCRLDPLVRTRNLDQNPRFVDPQFLVQFNDMQGLFDRRFLIKRETGVNFSGDSPGDDFEDFFAEFDEKTVECVVDLFINVGGFGFAVLAR